LTRSRGECPRGTSSLHSFSTLVAGGPRPGSHAPGETRERRGWLGEEIALEQIAAELDERVALLDVLDALAHDHHAHVLAERGHRANQLLLRRLLVHVAHQGHVELDDLGLKQREAREAGVTGAEIVDRDLKAHLAKPRDARGDVLDLLERCAFGDL